MVAIPRRRLLRDAGALTAATALWPLAACRDDEGGDPGSTDAPAARPPTSRRAFDPTDWASVRAQFPNTPQLAHFDAFVLAASPRPVADAVDEHRRGLDEATGHYVETRSFDLDQATTRAAARYLDAPDPDGIALTDSTTMGLGLVYGGLHLAAGDEVLTTTHDFFSTHESVRLRAVATGATIKRVTLYDDPPAADADEIVERLIAGVGPATRAVAITWVHSGTGVKLPVADIAAALAERNAEIGADEPALLCVDGVHGFGVEVSGVDELGCDVLVSGTHKWLFGPRGTGIVWATNEAWSRITDRTIAPFEGSSFQAWFDGTDPVGGAPGPLHTPGGYHTFEHRWALADAFKFHEDIGKAAIAARTHEQAAQLKDGLAAVDGVRVVTPRAATMSSGIVCVDVEGTPPGALIGPLRDAGFGAGGTPYQPPYLRFGPSMVTNPDEVDALVAAVADIVR